MTAVVCNWMGLCGRFGSWFAYRKYASNHIFIWYLRAYALDFCMLRQERTQATAKKRAQEVLVDSSNTLVSRQSVQFSRSVMSDSLSPHGLQHARLPCPSSTPRACSNPCPLSQWCHPAISSSVQGNGFNKIISRQWSLEKEFRRQRVHLSFRCTSHGSLRWEQ